ncbi:MAG: hypothetical protein AB1646_21045 [Thermodesulfobacteriota bacterium]
MRTPEQMRGFLFWQRWLVASGILITGFGLAMALTSGTALFDVFNRQIDPAFWGNKAPDDTAKAFQHWLYGVWGATIAGWGVFVAFVAYYPFLNREKWSRNCLVAGLVLWYLFDTALSAYHRVYFNVGFNTVLLIALMLPIIRTRKAFG